jgi:cytidyltransferase-like protein
MPDLVYIGGTFDLFHWGHVQLLKRACRYGDVVVALNPDDFAAAYKRQPIMNLAERWAVVEACKYVTHVDVNLEGANSAPTITRWRPRYIAHGDDWQGSDLLRQLGITEEFLGDYGIEMLYLPYTADISSSEVIARCRQSDLQS